MARRELIGGEAALQFIACDCVPSAHSLPEANAKTGLVNMATSIFFPKVAVLLFLSGTSYTQTRYNQQ